MNYEVQVRHSERRHIAAVRFRARVEEIGARMGEALSAVEAYLTAAGVPLEGPAVAVYEPEGEGQFDVAAGFPVQEPIEGDGHVVPVELPEGDVAVTTHTGPYDRLSQAYEAIQAWMREHGHEPAISMWEEYYSPPDTPPSETRTDVFWPLKPR
jgi:effector-binding domain-containing protein